MSENERGLGDNSVAKEELSSYARRLAALEDQKKEAVEDIAADIKELKAEAKGRGYSVKSLTKAVQLQRLDPEDRQMLGLYCETLGVFD